jgi:3-hydroxyisobutyrate dehydrogenase-like beta-hydroxyacid dehydrogenase
MRIGFIGLGAMGLSMARNLLRGGAPVQVWNRSDGPVQVLAGEGAQACATAADAAGADVLFSMLADDDAVRHVMVDGGVLDAMPPGSVHVNMATVSVAFGRELATWHAARGIGYVAAPVLGRVDVAAAGKLNILAAGPTTELDRVQPLFDLMGQKTWRFGGVAAQANAVKLAVNFNLACAIEAMAESAALVRAHGIDAADFLGLLLQTSFTGPAHQAYGKMIAADRYAPAGFKLTLGLKDVRLALAASDATHVPMPFASVLRDSLLDAVAHGDGGLDWASLAKVAARRAGLE